MNKHQNINTSQQIHDFLGAFSFSMTTWIIQGGFYNFKTIL